MYKYIKCDDSRTELPPINIVVEIDFYVESYISSSTEPSGSAQMSSREMLAVADSAFKSYMQSIVNVIEQNGFTEISRKKSPSRNSQSTYYTFCYLDDLFIQRVNMIFVFRVSNHPLPVRPWHRTPSDPETSQIHHYEGEIQQYRWLSDSGTDIELRYNGIQYNGNYYDNMNQILNLVKAELDNFKSAYPLAEDGYEVVTIKKRFKGGIPTELDIIQSNYQEFGSSKRFNTYDGAENYLCSKYSYYDEESDGYSGYVAIIRKSTDPNFIVAYLSYDGAVVDTSYLIT